MPRAPRGWTLLRPHHFADWGLSARVSACAQKVDALRASMLANVEAEYGLIFNCGVLGAVAILLVAIASKMYARMAY